MTWKESAAIAIGTIIITAIVGIPIFLLVRSLGKRSIVRSSMFGIWKNLLTGTALILFFGGAYIYNRSERESEENGERLWRYHPDTRTCSESEVGIKKINAIFSDCHIEQDGQPGNFIFGVICAGRTSDLMVFSQTQTTCEAYRNLKIRENLKHVHQSVKGS